MWACGQSRRPRPLLGIGRAPPRGGGPDRRSTLPVRPVSFPLSPELDNSHLCRSHIRLATSIGCSSKAFCLGMVGGRKKAGSPCGVHRRVAHDVGGIDVICNRASEDQTAVLLRHFGFALALKDTRILPTGQVCKRLIWLFPAARVRSESGSALVRAPHPERGALPAGQLLRRENSESPPEQSSW